MANIFLRTALYMYAFGAMTKDDDSSSPKPFVAKKKKNRTQNNFKNLQPLSKSLSLSLSVSLTRGSFGLDLLTVPSCCGNWCPIAMK
jgi:hypothetical protein